MSELSIKEPKEHGYRLIAVPSEKLVNEMDYTILVSEKNKYEIIEHFRVYPDDIFPYSHFYLAVGLLVDKKQIWSVYKKSEYIMLFLVKLER